MQHKAAVQHVQHVIMSSTLVCVSGGLEELTAPATSQSVALCATTETRPVDRLGEFEKDNNTDSDLESNTGSHSAQSKAHVAQQSAAERGFV